MANTPAELLEMALNGESLDGEVTDETGEQGNDGTAGANDTAVDSAQSQEASQNDDANKAGQTTGDESEGAPIVSKSGDYTIPYEKLEQARVRAKTLEGENATLRAQLAELSAKQQSNLERAEENAQDRADAGQAQTQADQNLDVAKAAIGQGVDISVFGDFSEEALSKGIQMLVSQAREQLRTELREENAQALKPLKDRQAQEASDGHYNAIFGKHPDANEIAQSVEFAAWLNTLPSFSRDAVTAVLSPETGGTAAQVIEVFDTFKAQTGRAAASRATGNAKAPEVQRRIPNSLSEAAGEQHQDVSQQVMATAGANPTALIERMQDMTPEQVERLLNTI
ncbi:hypothetical protein ACFIQF_22675 [Comamonas sp. J-3]|uniref:hypothetical protein n=1 Tax=Comamonas trifloxystrobinivorans TaxID=3350256 RepID=UPI00372CE63F